MKTRVNNLKLVTFTVVIFTTISSVGLHAQDYLISFAGTGGSTTVATVKVENLTQGTNQTMNGSDVLHLLGVVTGIETVNEKKGDKLTFSPNPMKEYTRMQFVLPEPGEAIITLNDLSGRNIFLTRDLLSKGQHTYRLQGISEGMYIVRISSGRYSLSGKLLCSGAKNSSAKLVYENTIPEKEKQVSTKGINSETVMQYNTGDRLKLTGISGNYSTVKMDIPASDKTITFNFIACTDGDNNNYTVVEIGMQVWMAENLKTTKYNLGTDIPYKPDAADWIAMSSPAFCWYNNDAVANKNLYGALYNWYAASISNLCPTGWHVPTEPNWTTLTTYLGGLNSAGGKMKETGNTHWVSPNTGATNESGFTGLPGGWRSSSSGTFNEIGVCGQFWSNTVSSNTFPFSFYLDYYYTRIYYETNYQAVGFNVRCLKN